MVSSAFAVELLRNALEIYSPSRSETKFANFLKDVCLDLGFEQANIDSVGNVIAMKGTGDLNNITLWPYGYCSWHCTSSFIW